MRSEADKKARIGRIGSADVAALTGHSSWRTPIDVWRSAVEGWEPEPSDMMEIGSLLEPVVLELYRRRTARHFFAPGQILHPEHAFLVDTPDALSWIAVVRDDFGEERYDVRAVEAKTCIGWQAEGFGEPGTDQVPPQYLVQSTCHMLHLRAVGHEVEACDLPVLIGGYDFRIYTIPWDQELADGLVKIARDFHEKHILPRVPPQVDATPAYSAFLRDTHPVEKAPIRDASDRARTLAASLRVARESMKRAEEIKRGLENELKAEIADAAGVQAPGFRITWTADKRGRRTMRVKFDDEQTEEAA